MPQPAGDGCASVDHVWRRTYVVVRHSNHPCQLSVYELGEGLVTCARTPVRVQLRRHAREGHDSDNGTSLVRSCWHDVSLVRPVADSSDACFRSEMHPVETRLGRRRGWGDNCSIIASTHALSNYGELPQQHNVISNHSQPFPNYECYHAHAPAPAPSTSLHLSILCPIPVSAPAHRSPSPARLCGA